MRQYLADKDGAPSMVYFGTCTTWAPAIQSVFTDPNDRDIYLKMDGDDEVDSSRYGFMGLYTVAASNAASKANNAKIHKIQARLSGKTWQEL